MAIRWLSPVFFGYRCVWGAGGQQVNTLRGMNALSVLDEGDLMAFPCQTPVSQRSTTVRVFAVFCLFRFSNVGV